MCEFHKDRLVLRRILKKLASLGYGDCTDTTLLGRLVCAPLGKCGGNISLLNNFL